MRSRIAAALFAVVAASAADQPKRQGAFPPAGYELQWSDDFNGNALDLTKWMYRTDVKALSSQRPENVRVEDGNLVILLKKENHRAMEHTGGGVISKLRFRYGYYEARARMHGGAGWHQSVWAMAASDGSTTYHDGMRTEIDGMEFDSDLPTKGHMGLIIWNGPNTHRAMTCTPGVYRNPLGFDASAEFHTYGFEWTEQSVKYYLDGDLRCSLDYPASAGEHDAINFWLTAIGYAQRAPREGAAANIDDAALPARMVVDFAAFYAKVGGP
jgi:beta-glucanase (GH16 family)